ncbi:MAG: hypothetical protein BWX80_01946 [Candidatus Hydrogenedentes bacterium ADurb.Bin101]|nr:MAG: hypothetical protein BWX80_01946 [Candidatus Hydrogenedentes bacterium ADurb.Bin101]
MHGAAHPGKFFYQQEHAVIACRQHHFRGASEFLKNRFGEPGKRGDPDAARDQDMAVKALRQRESVPQGALHVYHGAHRQMGEQTGAQSQHLVEDGNTVLVNAFNGHGPA